MMRNFAAAGLPRFGTQSATGRAGPHRCTRPLAPRL